MSPRIDVHHHFLFKDYVDTLSQQGGDPSGWHTPEWSEELDQEFNKRHGITTTILSLNAPGPGIVSGPASAKLARVANEEAAAIRDAHPQQYGFFAAVPSLLDTEAALSEIQYALDVLKADGVTLFTRYGDGNYYLGHEKFKPIWDELDKRAAVVFIHPTHPVDITPVNKLLAQPVIDYPHETTRAAVDLIVSNTVRTHQNVKIILSHAGGTLPWLAHRPASLVGFSKKIGKSLEEFLADAKSFYFDLALSGSPEVVSYMLNFAKKDHVLFGSDFPYADESIISYFNSRLAGALGEMGDGERDGISFGAAHKLFPRLVQGG
ncbi:Amidohydrolase family protein [Rutstroemia sp. NJR-2017a WRK4]|nr:Amidohydrolase family protein [Rutstroemia sp. NJR-2017a WRK4]